MSLVPYVGGYAEYQCTFDTAAPPAGGAITGDGLSGRLTTDIDIEADGGVVFSLAGEVGGLGTSLLAWAVEAGAGG